MKTLKHLKLYEEYINSSSNKVTTLLNNMVKMFIDTFEGKNDVLSKEELDVLSLVEIEKSITNDYVEKNILMDFSDTLFYYQLFFVIKLEDVKNNDPITKAYMKIKIYDSDNATMLREWQSSLDIQEATDSEISQEGRFFIKVKEQNTQSQPQSGQTQGQSIQSQSQKTNDYDYIENFIIAKIGELKEHLENKE